MRFTYANLEWCQEFYEQTCRAINAFEPRSQSCWFQQAYQLMTAARLAYALGHPLSVTRERLQAAVTAFRELFAQRGQTTSTRTLYRNGQPLPPEIIYEDGFTPVQCWDAAIVALIAHDVATARSLMELAGSNPGAQYVSPMSEVCTTSQQTLSNALNAALAGDFELAQNLARRLEFQKGTRLEQRFGSILAAIAADGFVFSEVEHLLIEHQKSARRPTASTDQEQFLCLPALGLIRLAMHYQRLKLADLDFTNDYAPVSLLGIEKIAG